MYHNITDTMGAGSIDNRIRPKVNLDWTPEQVKPLMKWFSSFRRGIPTPESLAYKLNRNRRIQASAHSGRAVRKHLKYTKKPVLL